MGKLRIFLAAVFIAPFVAHADAIGDIAKSKCMGCHNPTSSMARIEGQTAEFIYKSMIDYKNKVRKYDMMTKRVTPLDEATLRGLSDFFSKLPRDPAIKGDAALIALGKSLYENPIPNTGVRSCAECHGRQGEGVGFGNALNPRLAAQLSDHTISMMAVYKAGSIPGQDDMTKAAKALTDDQVKALAEYIQSL